MREKPSYPPDDKSYPPDDKFAMKRFVGQETFVSDIVEFQIIYLRGLPPEYDVRHDVKFVLELEGEKAEQAPAERAA